MENNFSTPTINSELRRQARESLKGNWGNAILVLVVFALVSGACSAFTWIPFVGFLIPFVLQGPLTLGFTLVYYKLSKNEDFSVADLFDGFKDFLRSFLTVLLIGIFVLLWTLLLVIPGIIAALSYSQALFILLDNPDLSAYEAIKESKRIMKGYKWKFFCLQLSFIGWALLSVLTFGIGYLWLAPYIQVSYSNFYKDIKK